MPRMHDDLYDLLLAGLTATTVLHLCSQEPTTYAEATSTYKLCTKASPSIGAVANATPDGRKRTVAAITDGVVNASGTATHWALVDGSRLLATNALSAGVVVVSGSTFTTTAVDIRVKDVLTA